MRAREFIVETLGSPYQLKLEHEDSESVDYTFKTDTGAHGDVQFWTKSDDGSDWEMAFTLDGRIEHQATNTGEVFRIFATAAKSVQLFLNTPEGNRMSTLSIGAKALEQSRVKLYDRMVPMLSKLGLKFTGTDNVGQYKNYHFVNPLNPLEPKSEPDKNWRDNPDWEMIEEVGLNGKSNES